MSFQETLDLTEVPIITFRSNGKKLNFLLDTGSNRSIIDKEAVKGCDYTMIEATNTLSGLDNIERTVNNAVIKLTYKDSNFIDVIQVDDLSYLFESLKQEKGIIVHGMLGTEFFTKYKYVLDFKENAFYNRKFL